MSSIMYVQRPAALFIWCPLTSIMWDSITSTLDSFSVQHGFSIRKSDWCDYMFINAQAFNTKNIIYYQFWGCYVFPLVFVLVELQHTHLFRKKTLNIWLAGVFRRHLLNWRFSGAARPPTLWNGGRLEPPGLFSEPWEAAWARSQWSIWLLQRTFVQMEGQTSLQHQIELYDRRWRLISKRQTKARIEAVGLNSDIVFGILMLILYFSEYYW